MGNVHITRLMYCIPYSYEQYNVFIIYLKYVQCVHYPANVHIIQCAMDKVRSRKNQNYINPKKKSFSKLGMIRLLFYS